VILIQYSGLGLYGQTALAVAQVCLLWETASEDNGNFVIQTRAAQRQAVLEQLVNSTRQVNTESKC